MTPAAAAAAAAVQCALMRDWNYSMLMSVCVQTQSLRLSFVAVISTFTS